MSKENKVSLSISAEAANVSACNAGVVCIDIDCAKKHEVLGHFSVNDVLNHFGYYEILNGLTEQEVIDHFGFNIQPEK